MRFRGRSEAGPAQGLATGRADSLGRPRHGKGHSDLNRAIEGGEPRDRLIAALEELGPDAATVFTPLARETALVEAGAISAPMADLEARWRASIASTFVHLGLPMPLAAELAEGRTLHGEPFRWLWTEFTSVRRLDPAATW